MPASVLGATALFSGRMSTRIDYDFDAAFALPAAAIGFGIALAGLVVLHATVTRPGLPISANTVVAVVSCALQVRWGVGWVRPGPSTSDSQKRALQWAALPERERTRILDDCDRAVRLLVERGLITEEQARRHVVSPTSL